MWARGEGYVWTRGHVPWGGGGGGREGGIPSSQEGVSSSTCTVFSGLEEHHVGLRLLAQHLLQLGEENGVIRHVNPCVRRSRKATLTYTSLTCTMDMVQTPYCLNVPATKAAVGISSLEGAQMLVDWSPSRLPAIRTCAM